MSGRQILAACAVALPLALAACGGDPEVVGNGGDLDGGGGSSGTSGSAGDGGTGGFDVDGGSGTGGSSGDGGNDPCVGQMCPDTQRCEVVDGGASCVPNECSDLTCSSNEYCEETPDGARCTTKCNGDVDCPENQWCDTSTGACEDDTCTPGETTCNGNELIECAQNGSANAPKYTCGSGSPYFTSTCTADPGSSEASCECEDDWDCPEFTECEVGKCVGTGVEPTCKLDPVPFNQALPAREFAWGGTQASKDAVNAPFPESAQVVQSPVVINLDDDTGDGDIDERDFPEIVFMTFCPNVGTPARYTRYGVLRAVHGGGPNKGQDFFANCAGKLWSEGDSLTSVSCGCQEADLDPTAGVAAGDLDGDGQPEIIGITGTGNNDGRVRIYDRLGNEVATSEQWNQRGANPTPAIANIDNEGFAEIIVGRSVFTVGHDSNQNLIFLDRFEGSQDNGTNGQGPASCVANLVGDSKQEIAAGVSVYRYPSKPSGAVSRADCTGSETGDEAEWCNGNLVTVWHAPDVPANNGQTINGEGFCAIADIMGTDQALAPGPNNPLDGVPEVLTISSGRVQVFNGQTGELLRRIDMNAGSNGGPPNIDDFDGDGFPEIGTAAETAYVVTDFQDPTTGGECDAWTSTPGDDLTDQVTAGNPARTPPSGITCNQSSDCGDTTKFGCNVTTKQCVCLHNSWRRATEDDSSRVTGSTLFDFNGDGAAEVVYNDECRFRVYDGKDGTVWFREPSESRTRIEYPVVADVDNDGNAEIVFATTNESGFCSEGLTAEYNNGIEVWGDAQDIWVSARRVWNQHAYNVTNVTEGGFIPESAPEHWLPLNGRLYNTFRSQPRAFGVAPDLTIVGIQVNSPDAQCGTLSNKLDITVQIQNIGDLRVGPGVVIRFTGTWSSVPLTEPLNDTGGTVPLTATLSNSLEPGEVVFVTVSYDAANNAQGTLPDKVTATVDDTNVSRECEEMNNTAEKDVSAGAQLADLRIQLDVVDQGTCPNPKVPTTIINDGSLPASNVVVRYFAGDPSAGGQQIHEVTRPGPIAAGGGTDSFTATIPNFPKNRSIRIYGVVDPDNAIEECNDGNNTDDADNVIVCQGIQ